MNDTLMKTTKLALYIGIPLGIIACVVILISIGRSIANSPYNDPDYIPSTDSIKVVDTIPTLVHLYEPWEDDWFAWYDSDTVIDSIDIYTENYHPPVLVGRHTSGYGPRWGMFHEGVDIGGNNRDTSYAVFDGVVRFSDNAGGYGNLVVIRHDNGLETFYAHHWHNIVERGDTVKAGSPLGIIGSTGISTGPHLHFEVQFLGKTMDPDDFFNVMSDTSNFTIKLRNRFRYNIIY